MGDEPLGMENLPRGRSLVTLMPLGLYISVPFCRTKCSFCNFASDVFSRAAYRNYVNRVCADIAGSAALAGRMGGKFEKKVDSIYLGGGTPSVLDPADLERIFASVHDTFQVAPDAEITVECAPGTLRSTVDRSAGVSP